MPLRPTSAPGAVLRGALLAVAAARIGRGARRERPLRPGDRWVRDVTVVVPARDEAERIGACVRSLTGQGASVIVVDDGSSDGTGALAGRVGASVVHAGELPAGWAGKAHALQTALEVATTPVVVAVDADCRLAPGGVAALVAALAGHALVSAGARVDADPGAPTAVHSSMLATLLYRFGPPGVAARRSDRTMANGQCMAFDRDLVLDEGGFAPVAGNLVEDLAIARHLAARGHRVGFVDGTAIATVDGYGGVADTLRGWGRSLALSEVTSRPWLALDLAVVWSAMALPLPRLLARRGDVIDLAAVALRIGVVAATARAFRRRGPALAAAPLADVVVAARLTQGALRPSRRWRGRDYG